MAGSACQQTADSSPSLGFAANCGEASLHRRERIPLRSAAQGSSEAPFASATGGRKPSEEKVVDRIPHDEQRCSTFFVIPRRYV